MLYTSLSTPANEEIYFSLLGGQCWLSQPICNAAELENALWKRLQRGTDLCLFISRLEKANLQKAEDFTKILCNFLNTTKLHLVWYGDKTLAELIVAGNWALQGMVEIKEWPEPTINDVLRLYSQQCLTLSPEKAKELLTMTGKHVVLLRHCLEYHANNSDFTINKCLQLLKQDIVITEAFGRFKGNSKHTQRLRQLLEQPEVAPAMKRFISDDLLRQLYWQNLLVRCEDRLVWRCEAVREAGKAILE